MNATLYNAKPGLENFSAWLSFAGDGEVLRGSDIDQYWVLGRDVFGFVLRVQIDLTGL